MRSGQKPESLSNRIRMILLDLRFVRRILYQLSSSYRKRWNLASLTESSAMDAILTGVSGNSEFEERGKQDAEVLRKFVDRESIVLDLGCGIGRVDKYLSPYCKKLYAVDVSDRMLAIARKRLTGVANVQLTRNNGHDLSEFPSETFDFVFALLVIHHLDKRDAQTYLQEIHRVLKKEGTAYLQFPNRLSEHFSHEVAQSRRLDVARTRWYDEPEAGALLRSKGFDLITSALDDSQIIEICRKSR